MARTPVKAEKKKPKREPVPVVSVPSPAVREPVLPTDDELNEVVGRVAKQPITPLDEDGHRICMYEPCGVSFKPKSLNPKDSDVTEFYCSSEHSIAAYYKKNNLGTPPARIVSGAESVTRHAVKQERVKARAEAEPRKLAKYGPLRAVSRVVKEGKASLRVLFECGHEGSIGSRAKQGRCRKCRVPQENRVEVATAKPKRTPVVEEKKPKRTPVKAEKKKLKRTPVKPPKKKGKR